MPVDWQRVPVSFVKGLDTKGDEKQVVPGTLTTLENGVFDTPGEINKRRGLSAWTTTVEGSGSIGSGVALSTYKDEVLVFTGDEVYSRITNGRWIRKGEARSIYTATDPIFGGSTPQRHPTMAASGGIELYAWEDHSTSTAWVRYSVFDTERRVCLVSNESVAAGSTPICVSFTGSLYVIYNGTITTGSGLVYRRLDPANPTTLAAQATMHDDVKGAYGGTIIAGANWDLIPITSGTQQRLYLVHASKVMTGSTAQSHRIKVSYFTGSALTYVSSTMHSDQKIPGNSAPAAFRTSRGPVAAWTDASSNVWWAATSGSVETFFANNDPVLYGGAVTWNGLYHVTESVLGHPFWNGGGASTMAGICLTGTLSTLYYEVTMSVVPNVTRSFTLEPHDTRHLDRFVGSCAFGVNRPPTTGSFQRAAALASKPFAYGDTHYVWLLHDSSEQPTYFLLNASGDVITKAAPGVAGYARRNRTLPFVSEVLSGNFRVPNQRQSSLLSSEGQLFSVPGIASTVVSFLSSSSSLRSVVLGNQLISAGGILESYDGGGMAEHGFYQYPQDLTASTSLTGGLVDSGTRSYCATYEWIDNRGQVHRSAPSLTLPVVLTATTGSVILRVPTLRYTRKESTGPLVQIGLYRTEDNGSLFYKITDPKLPLINTSSVDVVYFIDKMSDASLISNELLYTTSDELEHHAPPACTLIASWKNRAWLAGLEEPNELRYSKLVTENLPVAFNDSLYHRVDPRGGAITAIAPLDEQLIVFKRTAIMALVPLTDSGTPYGGGPDNTGLGGTFADRIIASDVGCINPDSVVVTGQGVFFQSEKGIYLLDRSLVARYIGAPVEAYNDLTITSAVLVPYANHVRFTTDSSIALVYDYQFDQWSTFTNYRAVDSTIVDDRMALLRSGGQVVLEDLDTYADDGAHVPLRLVTGWLSFAGLQGYQRARRFRVLGDYESAHQLSASVAFDYADFSQEATIDPAAVPGVADLYQFDLHLRRQKCTALQVSLQDVATGSAGRGMSLANLTFEVGVKDGPNRTAKGRHNPFR